MFPMLLLGQGTVAGSCHNTPVQSDTTIQGDTWFGKDKAYHVLGSFTIVCMGTWIHGQYCENGSGQDIRFGAGMAFTLGLTKELIDKYSVGRHFSVKDLVADMVGIILGGLFLSLI